MMDQQRRQLLNAGAAGAAAALLAGASAAPAGADTPATAPAVPPGNPGDFDFLTGEWRVSHRRQPQRGAAWEAFEGEASVRPILGGVGSVEELRMPSLNRVGMGLRLLDVESRVWIDYWVDGRTGALTPPGQRGGFENCVGTFESDEFDGNQPIKVRGIWDEVTPTTCRWRQTISRDAGATWEENWVMHWRRA